MAATDQTSTDLISSTSTSPGAEGSGATTERPTLLLDGHSLAYRAFFALPIENFGTTTGQHTNAVYGFTSMLINVPRRGANARGGLLRRVPADVPVRGVRRLQGQLASKSPDEFKGQVSLVKEVLDALQVPAIDKDGFEADDVIATLATQAETAGFDVLICTGDRDAFHSSATTSR